MQKVLCVFLGIGLLCGSMAPQATSVHVPVLKRAAQRAMPPEKAADPKLLTPPVKLGRAQLKAAIQPTLTRPVAGISGFLRLDARTPFVSGKGSLKTSNSAWHDPKGRTVVYTNRGGVELEFLARSGPATYLVDFEFVAIAHDAEFTAHVGDSVASTTVTPGRHHLLYLLDANGGSQLIEVRIDGFVGLKGVEISILE